MTVIATRALRLLSLAGILVCLFSPGRASAQDDATVEMARQRFREGVQFFDQKQFEKARLAFLQAYALKPHPAILLNLAQSELRSGRPDDAAAHFSEYLRANAGTDAERQEAETAFTTAKSKVGEITVSVDTQGVTVAVDGQDKGQSPLPNPLFVQPGTHSVEARAGEHRTSKSVTVAAGQSITLNLALRTSSAAAVAAAPAASGEEATPESAEPAAPPKEAETSTPESTEPVESAPASRGRKPFFQWFGQSPVAWVGAGLTVVGVTMGVIMGVTAKHDFDNANSAEAKILERRDQDFPTSPQPSPCNLTQQDLSRLPSGIRTSEGQQFANACKIYSDDKNAGDGAKTFAIVSSVVAGVAFAGTILYYFADPKAEEDSGSHEARVVPWFAPGTSGIIAVGRF